MEKINFDIKHDLPTLNQCFGISDEKRERLYAGMFYHYIYRQYLSESLFDKNNVPDNFNRKSNVLEVILNEECDNAMEQVYIGIEYGRFDARIQDEDKKLFLTMMVFEAKLTKLKYDKEKFLQWYVERVAEDND